jgi:hypothetical protein
MTSAYLEASAISGAFNSPTLQNQGLVLDAIEVGNEGSQEVNRFSLLCAE